MHAIVVVDGELDYVERDDPRPGDTEILVAVKAAGLNGADMMQRRGLYPAPPGAPADIPGLELAGEVIDIGAQVTRFVPGQRVMALVGGGGQATMAVVDEAHALSVPDATSWSEAGGFCEVFSTAYDALFTKARLEMGQRLLVTGAAGGVGTAAVQLGACTGATVVASVRNPAHRDDVVALGATHAIDPAEVAAFGPYDVVIELVGAASAPAAVSALATGGRLVVIGVGSGAKVELNLLELMSKRAWIGGSMLRARDRTEKGTVAAAMAAHVVPLLGSGTVQVPIAATFPMAEAERGVRALQYRIEARKSGPFGLTARRSR